ncbi:hypothetical protein BOTBODRAFT_64267 [Botryobasidium botryosum FD-172 SS1]|uniref:Glycoside hydrolase 131 catalytic N-terminal domain-containing protein n=1 Tax=Botryobasidium botryosum (strain FD-172 SS1) TaxID=930990 RepID=A0A067N0D2_BOTB1|nr:hypothetical protein BOTBODRAFT_64267 [Botryobasidium botryosum FD-172 SS1]
MMLVGGLSSLLFVSLVSASPAQKGCKILFDGRIPLQTTPADFTKSTSLYNTKSVLGQNQTWAEVIKEPLVALPSLVRSGLIFRGLAKPFEVTITDQSIFVPGSGPPQGGFRRSELIPMSNNGTDPTVAGTTTVHFSIQTDPFKPLNYSHEYHPIWHERNDYNGNHFNLQTGTPFSAAKESIPIRNPKTLRITGWSIPTPEQNVFITDFNDLTWHNFALTIGWSTNKTTVYYSKGYEPLKKVAGPFSNDNSNGGQFHFGFLKLPTGPDGIDVAHTGYQERIKGAEGLIYGGIFIEDSSDGCITLS